MWSVALQHYVPKLAQRLQAELAVTRYVVDGPQRVKSLGRVDGQERFVGWLVSGLTSQQHASVSQGRTC